MCLPLHSRIFNLSCMSVFLSVSLSASICCSLLDLLAVTSVLILFGSIGVGDSERAVHVHVVLFSRNGVCYLPRRRRGDTNSNSAIAVVLY